MRPYVLVSTASIILLGGGYVMWSVISPEEEYRKAQLKNMPESNPMRREETRRRNALVMQVLKESAESKDNIARGMGGPPN